MKFRKKPIVIEAMQFDGANTEACCRFIGRENIASCGPGEYLGIYTHEGVMMAVVGDWIIEEPFPTTTRKFYPCKPDIFAATYELAECAPAAPPVWTDTHFEHGPMQGQLRPAPETETPIVCQVCSTPAHCREQRQCRLMES